MKMAGSFKNINNYRWIIIKKSYRTFFKSTENIHNAKEIKEIRVKFTHELIREENNLH